MNTMLYSALQPYFDDPQFIEEICDRLLVINPMDASALTFRGWARHRQGLLREAEADFCRALEIEPYNPALLNDRGLVRERLGNLPGALEDFSLALQQDGRQKKVLYNRALLHRELGRLPDSITDLRALVEIDGEFEEAWFLLGNACLETSDTLGALEAYDRLLERKPDHQGGLLRRGVARGLSGDFQRALEDFDRLRELNPVYPDLYFNRAMSLYHLGRFEEAQEDFRLSISEAPESAMRWCWMANAMRQSGAWQEACEANLRAIELDPSFGQAYVGLSMILYLNRELVRAEEVLSQAIAAAPDYALSYYCRGMLRMEEGRYLEGMADLVRAAERGNGAAREELGE